MTDRLKGCTVVFDRDIREDDVKPLLNAIEMLKGVLKVKPTLSTPDDYHARMRLQAEIEQQLLATVFKFDPDRS